MSTPIPIYLLSGFLGSGKTTLLNHTLDYLKESGKKPAVVMNELGDINIDGKMVDQEVPMAEMLSGCICCTISGDLGQTIYELCRDHQPDVILIEATGVANPLEIIHSVTDASLLLKAELRQIVTIIDAPVYLELCRGVKGRIYQLMGEQIMAAGTVIVNKIDKISPEDLVELEDRVRDWNTTALICYSVHCEDCLDFLEEPKVYHSPASLQPGSARQSNSSHHSHEHIMVYTHYFEKEVEREAFEGFLSLLPPNVYRAKGLIRFAGRAFPSLFQYTHGDLDIFSIRSDVETSNVSVFIGDHFSKQDMANALRALELS